jgi:hypothetical protein
MAWFVYPFTLTKKDEIYGLTTDACLIYLSIDGEVKWRHSFDNRAPYPPVFGPDGMVCIAMNEQIGSEYKGYLYVTRFDEYGDPVLAEDEKTKDGCSGRSPACVKLGPNYPNPFNPSTTIEFTLPETGITSLVIYNIAGQKVRRLIAELMTAGKHTVVWDGKDESGLAVSAGIYFARLTCGVMTTTGKMVLIK